VSLRTDRHVAHSIGSLSQFFQEQLLGRKLKLTHHQCHGPEKEEQDRRAVCFQGSRGPNIMLLVIVFAGHNFRPIIVFHLADWKNHVASLFQLLLFSLSTWLIRLRTSVPSTLS